MSGQAEVKKAMNFRSIAVTLTLAFLTLSLAILVISSGLQAYFSYHDRQNVIAEHQHFIAQEAANEVKNFIDAKINTLGAASRFTDLAESGKEEQKRVLNKLLGFDPSFRQVVLLDTEGQQIELASRVLTSTSGNFTGQVESSMLSQASTGKTYISPVYLNEVTNEPMIVMAVPATDVFGDFKGVLMAEVNLKFMWDLVDKIKVGKSGTAYVVDRRGNLIAFSDISRVLKGEKISYLDEVKEFMSGEKGGSDPTVAKFAKGIKGTDVINTHISLDTPDWAVITELPVSEANEPIIQQFKITLAIVIANILLSILIARYISKRITKPIMMLSDAANEMGKGNLRTKLEINSANELGQLAFAFNTMADQLNKSREGLKKEVAEKTKELEAGKTALELQVKERTKELEKAKAGLEAEVQKRTKELEDKVAEMKRFNKMAVGRELKMIELKKKIAELEGKE